jgi:AraC family transcriptional regulator of adaptative response / DNA-3-methyladenine glycosylase II
MARFLAPRATPGVETIDQTSYRRSARINGVATVLEVRPVPGERHLLLHLPHPRSKKLISAVERVRRLFDLDADPQQINDWLARDVKLGLLVRARPGLRVPGCWDGFELAVRAILGQQISVNAATTLGGRLVRAFGTPLPSPVLGLTHLFPQPAELAEADLASIGLPRDRAGAIRALARAVLSGAVVLDGTQSPEETTVRLQALPGIGEWTAAYVAMRALRDPDAFPASDLGLRRAAAGGERLLPARELERQAQAWQPWRAYAAMHLWMSLGLKQSE